MVLIKWASISVLGSGAVLIGLAYHAYTINVRAAKRERDVPPALYFPQGAVWSRPIDRDPLDARSSRTISWLAEAGGWGRGRMQVDFSLRVLQADANTSLVPIRRGSDLYTWDSDIVPSVPLPSGGGMEGQTSYRCAVDQEDCHLLVVDRDRGKLFEAWQADYRNGALEAKFLAVWDLHRIYPTSGRGDGCTSADAAGFPIAALLFNADEIAGGTISHAIRFILPNQRIRAGVYVHPATHAGAPRGPDSAPPMGTHFRLRSSFDLAQLKPSAQVVARAMQRYGMFLSDGGNIALTAQSDMDTKAKYADLDFGPHDLEAIKVTDFEVVDGGTPISMSDVCIRNP